MIIRGGVVGHVKPEGDETHEVDNNNSTRHEVIVCCVRHSRVIGLIAECESQTGLD